MLTIVIYGNDIFLLFIEVLLSNLCLLLRFVIADPPQFTFGKPLNPETHTPQNLNPEPLILVLVLIVGVDGIRQCSWEGR